MVQFKEGSGDIPILIRPRQNGIVIDLVVWQAQYGWVSGDPLMYTLVAETADKTDMLEIPYDPGSSTSDGIFFVLPAQMFTTSQRSWTVVLKFLFNTTTDYSLYNFDVKVTKADSVNSR